MKLSKFKTLLKEKEKLTFKLPDGKLVPSHFHVTEVGKVSKHFIDCGGVLRQEKVVNFQLWEANDYDHRLHPEKLLYIINLAQEKLNIGDLDIEVEYQGETIGKYDIGFDGMHFLLKSKMTDCLAKDKCGIPEDKPKLKLSEIQNHNTSCCSPQSGCC